MKFDETHLIDLPGFSQNCRKNLNKAPCNMQTMTLRKLFNKTYKFCKSFKNKKPTHTNKDI